MADTVQWVVLELGPKAEGEDPDDIRASIRHIIRDADVFIPAAITQMGEERVVQYLVEGYAFIKRCHPDQTYLRLENTKYVQAVLRQPTNSGRGAVRALAYVGDREIEKFRQQIRAEVDQGIAVGDIVMITSGAYRQIQARVEEEIPEHDAVQVFIRLRSKEAIVTLPRACLRLVQKAPKSPFRERTEAVRNWLRSVGTIVSWPKDALANLHLQHQASEKLGDWLVRGLTCINLLKSVDPPKSQNFDARAMEWIWLDDVLRRLDAVRNGVEKIEFAIRSGGKTNMAENLIVDGTQLAIRCVMSGGLDSLKDSKGRPTGAILGFLTSLGRLKKRYQLADIYVTWDGSSQRRRKMFPGYKASRSGRSPLAVFEIQQLVQLLPKLGVHQAFNPEEEADDVIATLVRGPLNGAHNVIVSTDRDLLQLVTDTTQQFVPAVGVGKEKVYTVESVTQEYGVGPDQIVSVRALSGDSSDEIPGVDGFGLKTSSKLVKLYGGIDRLFASNFAELTKKQYGNLRAAEQQVKLNLELLKLRDDISLTRVGPDPDQIAAAQRLRDVDIKPDSILAAFFGHSPGMSATSA